MDYLINIKNNKGILTVSSREVYINFQKEHSKILRRIDEMISEKPELASQKYFIETIYKIPGNNKSYREYLLTRDGFLLLVMGFTGAKALDLKLKYIEAFNKMEQSLKEPYVELSKELRAIFALDRKTNEIENRIIEVEETAFILPFQKKALINARTKKVLSICGGKNSLAYKDRSFRGRIYSNIFVCIKEYFRINEYDAIPRKKFGEAMSIIEGYSLPIHLQYEIEKIMNSVYS